MLRAGFEPAIPIFDRPKAVCILDDVATEFGVHVTVKVYNTVNNLLKLQLL